MFFPVFITCQRIPKCQADAKVHPCPLIAPGCKLVQTLLNSVMRELVSALDRCCFNEILMSYLFKKAFQPLPLCVGRLHIHPWSRDSKGIGFSSLRALVFSHSNSQQRREVKVITQERC